MTRPRRPRQAKPRGTAAVFLGGGRITAALVAGLRLAGDQRPIVVYDRHPEKLRAFNRNLRVEIAQGVQSALQSSGMHIVAVRPASVKELLAEVAAFRAQRLRLCVSLAAGIPLENLRSWLGPPVRWARAMPSPVCRMAHGLTAICFERSVTKAERSRVRQLFTRVGPVLEVPEAQFDAFTATYSSTHGYHAVATLAKAALEAGLDREMALTAAAHALSDGIAYWRESGVGLEEMLREAATPGGIAAATMAAMDRSGYGRAVANGLKAGINQARRNARR